MGLIAREDADIVKGYFPETLLVWNVIRLSPCHLFGIWAKRRMTSPDAYRPMHIVYEPMKQISRTIAHVWFFSPRCQVYVFLGAKQSPKLTNPIKIYDYFVLYYFSSFWNVPQCPKPRVPISGHTTRVTRLTTSRVRVTLRIAKHRRQRRCEGHSSPIRYTSMENTTRLIYVVLLFSVVSSGFDTEDRTIFPLERL